MMSAITHSHSSSGEPHQQLYPMPHLSEVCPGNAMFGSERKYFEGSALGGKGKVATRVGHGMKVGELYKSVRMVPQQSLRLQS